MIRQPSDHTSERFPTLLKCVSGAIQAGELHTSDCTLLRLAVRSMFYCCFKSREFPMSHSLISLPS